MSKKRFWIVPVVALGMILPFSNDTAHAYVLYNTDDCPKVTHPKDLYYWIDPAFLEYSGKTTEVKESILKWNSLPEIEFTKKVSLPGGADITIEYIDKYSGDTYGKYVRGSRGSVIIYKNYEIPS